MEIVKRKRGNKEYFYLQHSFRKGNKVISNEKYLGLTIPENIELLKIEMLVEEKQSLYKKFEMIKKNFQIEWKKLPETVKQKELREIAIAFTYNTNAIEGSKITLSETREIINDKQAPSKLLRDIKETEAHANVFLEMVSDNEIKNKINEKLLLEWHNKIFGETKKDISGTYRDYLVRVGDYLAVNWQDIPKMIKELVDFSSRSKINVVELAAIVHYRFEKIHPFGDGNGRIGRLLMNKILWDSGYPMLIIEYSKRQSYYTAFKRDETGFVRYFFRRYLAVNKKRLK